jgi:hypothetical protein
LNESEVLEECRQTRLPGWTLGFGGFYYLAGSDKGFTLREEGNADQRPDAIPAVAGIAKGRNQKTGGSGRGEAPPESAKTERRKCKTGSEVP